VRQPQFLRDPTMIVVWKFETSDTARHNRRRALGICQRSSERLAKLTLRANLFSRRLNPEPLQKLVALYVSKSKVNQRFLLAAEEVLFRPHGGETKKRDREIVVALVP